MRWWKNLLRWLVGDAEKTPSASETPPHGDFVRPATWLDVMTVAGLLEKHGVDYVLIGGYALYANGLTRATGDVDILVRNTPKNNRLWIAALSELPDRAVADLAGEDNPFPEDEDMGGDPGVIRVFDVFIVDVMPKACGLTYDDLEPHIVRTDDGGQAINTLNLEGLLKTKQGVRDQDVSDRVQLQIALGREAALNKPGKSPIRIRRGGQSVTPPLPPSANPAPTDNQDGPELTSPFSP